MSNSMNNLPADRNKSGSQIALLMVVLILFSKLLGFVREMLLAAYYGTGYVTDAFILAQSIPNIILGGVFVSIATAYMPLYSERCKNGCYKSGNVLTTQIIVILAVFSLAASIMGFLFAGQIIKIFAPGLKEKAADLAIFYVKITFMYTVFTSIAGIFKSYLQYKQIFLLEIVIEYVQNLSVIVMIVVSAKYDCRLLACGLLIGYIARCILLYISAYKHQYRIEFQLEGFKTLGKDILWLAVPVFLGTSMQEINVFVDRMLASGLPTGSISSLNYANQINSIVISMTVTVITTIIYPRLVNFASKNEEDHFNCMIQKGFNIVLILGLPISLGGILYSREIITFIYQRGVFDTHAAELTIRAYRFYAAGVLFLSINDFLTKVYYSLHSMRKPMIYAAVSMVTNICLNLLLVNYLAHVGLAFATVVSSALNSVLLYYGIKKYHGRYKLIKSFENLTHITFSAICSVALCCIIYRLVYSFELLDERVLFLCIIGLTGIMYYVLLMLMKVSEVLEVVKSLLRRKTK